jgi:uncharacterized protein (DUF3084 family)
MSLEVFLILLVLVLSGAIATMGDRIGTKVGKARLSLFNLRPKKTAVLVTILTGMLISASTMGLLLLVSRGMRDRLLNFDKIRRGLRQDVEKAQGELGKANTELEKANADRTAVQNQLRQSKLERERAQVQLARINTSLKGALDRQRQTEALRQRVEVQRNQIQGQLIRVSDQAFALKADIGRLERDRQTLLQQRNQVAAQIAQRDQRLQQQDQRFQQQDQAIAQQQIRLKQLEGQQRDLQAELQQLLVFAEQAQLALRVGNLAVTRGYNLALGLVQAQGPSQARQAVEVMLIQANRTAIQRIQPEGLNPNVPIIQVEQADIERKIAQIADGTPYVLRIVSLVNYLRGEPINDQQGVRAVMQVMPKRTVFPAGTVINRLTIDNPQQRSLEELEGWVTQQLVGQANLAVRQQADFWGAIANVRLQSASAVVQQLQQLDGPVEVRVVAAADAPVEGPLRLEFVVVQAGQVLLQTGELSPSQLPPSQLPPGLPAGEAGN